MIYIVYTERTINFYPTILMSSIATYDHIKHWDKKGDRVIIVRCIRDQILLAKGITLSYVHVKMENWIWTIFIVHQQQHPYLWFMACTYQEHSAKL